MIFTSQYSKLKKIVAVALFNLIFFELFLTIYVHLNADSYIAKDESFFPPDKNAQQRLKNYFNPQLGWKPPLKTALGERLSAPGPTYKNVFAVTFGDSFTWGTQVKDDETWQSILEKKVNARVLNFGVESYGVDQAVKYFSTIKEKLPNSNYVILGFIDDDLRRNMTSYRKFQQHFNHDFPFTKPRFELQQEQLVFIPNPSQTFEDALRLSEPHRLQEIMRNDKFYSRYKKPEFPYLLNLLSPNAFYFLKGLPTESPLLDPEMRNLFKALLNLFRQEAASKKMNVLVVRYPSILMFTKGPDGRLIADSSDEFVQAENAFSDICQSLQINCYFPIKDFIKKGVTAKEYQEANGYHYTASGNALFAEVLNNYLNELSK